MTDIQLAKNNLAGHTICLALDGKYHVSDKHSIAPMMDLIEEGVNLVGYSVADLVVGKAAAMLFVKCGIKNVFAKILSHAGKRILELYGVYYEYEMLVDKIVNRDGTDICPMEKTVAEAEDVEEAYILLKNRIAAMRGQK